MPHQEGDGGLVAVLSGHKKARRIGLSQVSTEAFHRYWLHSTTLVKLLVLLLPAAHKLSEGG